MSQNIALNRRKFFIILMATGSFALAFIFFYLSIDSAFDKEQKSWFFALCACAFFVVSFVASGALKGEKLQLYKQIFERSNDAIAVISPLGEYIAQNESHRKLIGFDNKRLIEMPPCYYAGGSKLKTLEELTLLESFSGEFKVEKYGGSLLDVSLSAYTVKDELNDPMFFVEVKRDIREFKKIQEEIKAAHTSIKDSINYASRIQRSFLPKNDEFLERAKKIQGSVTLRDLYVYWHPKDTIGGDCYWFEVDEDGFFVAIIDCTGHGIPGAMMTFVVLSALRGHCQNKNLIKNPSLLMSAMNDSIKEALNQKEDGSESNDGMDAAFLYFDVKNSKLSYCGANISLFYQKSDEEEIGEIRPEKSSVGYSNVPMGKAYSARDISVERGIKFYLSTDGIFDQIGGKDRLSFGKKRFKAALTKYKSFPSSQQIALALTDFFEYKGEERQRDDNTVIGFYF